MLAYCFNITPKQQSHLLTINPNGIILHPHLKAYGLVGLVEHNLTFICRQGLLDGRIVVDYVIFLRHVCLEREEYAWYVYLFFCVVLKTFVAYEASLR